MDRATRKRERAESQQFDRILNAFRSETGEIESDRGPVLPGFMALLLSSLVVAFICLSLFVSIDRIVESTQGAVVTQQPSIVLQALDSSLIKSINVSEGTIVKRGQVLETLDPTFADADTSALQSQLASIDAQIGRNEAERDESPLFYPETVDPVTLRYQTLQRALFDQQRSQHEQQLKVYAAQISQIEANITKSSNEVMRLKERLAISSQIEKMWTSLQAKDSGSLLQSLTAKDNLLQIQKDVEYGENALVELGHQLAGTTASRDSYIQQWKGQVSQELVNARNLQDNVREQLSKATRRSSLVHIEAPDDAIVLSMPKLSVGSVIKGGDTIMTLALLTAPVEVEIEISPRDIGFVRTGDDVVLKFDAFEFVEHGTAAGRIRWISEGTFNSGLATGTGSTAPNENVQSYYKARVEITKMDMYNLPSNFRLLPGMTLTADIHVGQRSLFLYLIKGLVRTAVEAMREPR